MSAPCTRFYEFGAFCVDAESRLLLRDGAVVPLTPKVFDTLLLLVQHQGQVLEKGRMIETLWPDSFVEEGNLTYNNSAIRKALGESPSERRYVITVPGRGYRFAADVTESDSASEVIVARYTKSTLIIQDQEPSQPTEATPQGLPTALVTRHRRLVFIGLVLAMLTLAAMALYLLRGKGQPARHEVHAIAILPFVNTDADPNANYLGDGITESLINSLSQVSQLKVMARTATLRYKGKETDAQGKRDQALRVINELQQLPGVGLSHAAWVARIYAMMNEKQEALDWLERGLQAGAIPHFFKDAPVWDTVRGEPRFHELLQRMGIPQ